MFLKPILVLCALFEVIGEAGGISGSRTTAMVAYSQSALRIVNLFHYKVFLNFTIAWSADFRGIRVHFVELSSVEIVGLARAVIAA